MTAPSEAARHASLRYVSDAGPGIRRLRAGRGFRYLNVDHQPLRRSKDLERIKSLVIPPAWTNVWICPLAHGHIQATGFDARGRKQYVYHPRWRAVRDATKFHRLIDFARALPGIRRRMKANLALPGLPRAKVLATVIRLLEKTLIRIGNEEYTRANGSYGLTTLHNRHVKVHGAQVRFEFRGKSGVQRSVSLADRRLARIIKKCQDLPGHELFQYVKVGGKPHAIDSADVNEYLKEITGEDFTAKDFRTWAGTVLAIQALREPTKDVAEAEAKRRLSAAVASVAQRLGNTQAVCRKCYIHPAVLDSYLQGTLAQSLAAGRSSFDQLRRRGLHADEAVALAFLTRQARSQASR